LLELKVKCHVQALSEAPGAAAGNSSAAAGTGASGISGSKISGGVKAMLGSLLPERGGVSYTTVTAAYLHQQIDQ
jgi:hypothetical protein